ncbi:hypothetical protein CYLTODRAFT_422638 [Cylindrobasidium torrendii FP15055 ss-10]|uniref:Uncharacterized protein n=1 Tax=Cylindrobasidium torrendii FP15055 ss-10 TaxID=1314674 RepID=A0A0D7BAQ6_9AGAR|nr:hypothetical protein CYLTODRAFT_422638 [Cylindrobasidium torrendii FP15055 ss-10]
MQRPIYYARDSASSSRSAYFLHTPRMRPTYSPTMPVSDWACHSPSIDEGSDYTPSTPSSTRMHSMRSPSFSSRSSSGSLYGAYPTPNRIRRANTTLSDSSFEEEEEEDGMGNEGDEVELGLGLEMTAEAEADAYDSGEEVGGPEEKSRRRRARKHVQRRFQRATFKVGIKVFRARRRVRQALGR